MSTLLARHMMCSSPTFSGTANVTHVHALCPLHRFRLSLRCCRLRHVGRQLPLPSRSTCTCTSADPHLNLTLTQYCPAMIAIMILVMVLMFILTDANEATYSIVFAGSMLICLE